MPPTPNSEDASSLKVVPECASEVEARLKSLVTNIIDSEGEDLLSALLVRGRCCSCGADAIVEVRDCRLTSGQSRPLFALTSSENVAVTILFITASGWIYTSACRTTTRGARAVCHDRDAARHGAECHLRLPPRRSFADRNTHELFA